MGGYCIMITLRGHINFIPNFEEAPNQKAILTTVLEVRELLEVYKIDDTVNRDIREDKINQLVNYLGEINSDLGIYIPAIMLSYEGEDPLNDGNEKFLFDKQRNFVVLDGQHRVKAFERYIKKETDQNKIDTLLTSHVTVQVYFKLNDSEKRQLFIEINGKSKRVSQNVSVRFDDRNPINSLVTDLIKIRRNNPIIRMGIEQKRTRVVRPGNKKWISMKRLATFISMLLFGTLKPSKENMKRINANYEDFFAFLKQFFVVLEDVLPKEPGDVKKSILGHEAIQNTIAIVCHEFIFNNENYKIPTSDNWKNLVEILEFIDWRTNSTLFNTHLTMSSGRNQYVAFPDNKHYDLVPLLRDEITSLLN